MASGFSAMKSDELIEVAETFGVDVEIDGRWGEDRKHATALSALLEDGITWEFYMQSVAAAEAEAETELPEDDEPVVTLSTPVASKEFKNKESEVLVRMLRKNPSYEIRGYKFTKQHPFAAMKEGDADYVVKNEEGFRYATTEELEEYYS